MSNLWQASIPKDWTWKTVGEFTTDHKQGYYTKESYTSIGTYLIRITDLGNPKIDYSEMPRLAIDEKEFQQFKVNIGDFLFARSGAIGRYGIVAKNHPAVFASYLIRFRFDECSVFTRYFGYLYESDLCQKQLASITQGSSNININAENIKSLSVPFAPFPEQQKIAAILTVVDDVIESTQAQINKLKDLKTGMMQELLTKGIGHTKFKDSPVGRIPANWDLKPLDMVVEQIVDCEHKTAPYVEKSNYIVIRTNNVKCGQLVFDDIKYTTEDGYREWTGRLTPAAGDVLFTREAPAGESCMVPRNLKVCMGQRMVLLRPDKLIVDGEYFSLYLNSQTAIDSIFRFSIGTTVSRINIEDIRKIPCVIPALEEQRRISKSVNSVQISILALEETLQKSENMKKALMQDLLTGKVRVNLN